ncbi:hypothetical protein [Actinoplanes sp. NBRC 103695]|uniref:hypothetical protein n=1 Tax=Actinoplanes sp. NBRC 103695 TaxID=3032202 RepID=UPI0024A58C97|nr:hypothetical protein [Actinoplanes sp. NBRC 103695]GLY99757.1 hypothetical protein Acsp02_70100 [Actinoplanes sp. NBRC 103695]
MTDIEDKLRDTLHADADHVVAPADLPERAVARAGRIRRRRRASVAAAGAAVAVLAVVATVPVLRPPPPAPPAHTAPAIGTEPDTLHFDVDARAMGGSVQYVASGPGFESILVYRKGRRGNPVPVVRVYLATSAEAMTKARGDGMGVPAEFWKTEPGTTQVVTVAGRSGEIERQIQQPGRSSQWLIRWEPMPGVLGVLVSADDDRAAAIAAVDAVLLDRTRPCLLQFRFTELPPSWKQTSCYFVFLSGPRKNPATTAEWQDGSATLRVRAGVKLGYTVTKPDMKVEGAAGQWRQRDKTGIGMLSVPDIRGGHLSIDGVTRPITAELARNLVYAEDWNDPETWPR